MYVIVVAYVTNSKVVCVLSVTEYFDNWNLGHF